MAKLSGSLNNGLHNGALGGSMKPFIIMDKFNKGITPGKPLSSPSEAMQLRYRSGRYFFRSGSMSSAVLLEFEPDYYESRGWVCVFRSVYRSIATTNMLGLNIPMGGLLVQRDALDIRAAVYWTTPILYNPTGPIDTATSGYSPRRVMLGSPGGHGIYNTSQLACAWSNSSGSIGAGFDGTNCGSSLNDLIWGTGTAVASYNNRSGIWSHWITW